MARTASSRPTFLAISAVAVLARCRPSRREAHGCRCDGDGELETQPGQGGKRERLVPPLELGHVGLGHTRACCPARSATGRAPPGSAAPVGYLAADRRTVPQSARTAGFSNASAFTCSVLVRSESFMPVLPQAPPVEPGPQQQYGESRAPPGGVRHRGDRLPGQHHHCLRGQASAWRWCGSSAVLARLLRE